MGDWEQFQNQWTNERATMSAQEYQSLLMLLQTEDEEQVLSTFSLLLSYGECALCEILFYENGLKLCAKKIAHHQLFWMKSILEEVSDEESMWYPLFSIGYFDSFTFHRLFLKTWDRCSTKEQELLVRISLDMVDVPAGSFMMGARTDDTAADEDEMPLHLHSIPHDLMVCRYPVTHALFCFVSERNQRGQASLTQPVVRITWFQAILFCNHLSAKYCLAPAYTVDRPSKQGGKFYLRVYRNRGANGYRLLEEAEWEYCARAGSDHIYCGEDLETYAWFGQEKRFLGQPVGLKNPNAWGLYDMLGNVGEWVFDAYSRSSYQERGVYDLGDDLGRVFRGGMIYYDRVNIRASQRFCAPPNEKRFLLGFRICRQKGSSVVGGGMKRGSKAI